MSDHLEEGESALDRRFETLDKISSRLTENKNKTISISK